jgi:hypothetical protein
MRSISIRTGYGPRSAASGTRWLGDTARHLAAGPHSIPRASRTVLRPVTDTRYLARVLGLRSSGDGARADRRWITGCTWTLATPALRSKAMGLAAEERINPAGGGVRLEGLEKPTVGPRGRIAHMSAT